MANTYDKKYSPFQIVLSIFFILVILAVLLPIINIVATSFSGRESIAMGKVGLLPVDFTTSAYKMVFRDKSMLRSLAFSIAFLASLPIVYIEDGFPNFSFKYGNISSKTSSFTL